MAAFDVHDLDRPLIVAPMAGGPSTPELAAAGTNAGGLGFLAAGYLSSEAFADRITAARRLTSGPLGVNIFVPQPSAGTAAQVDDYAAALDGEAKRYDTHLGAPRYDDDEWSAKLDVVLDLRPQVVSFTFGTPTAQQCGRLRSAGITTAVTVTRSSEAEAAISCGIDMLIAQGPEAGGHRGTFDPAARPSSEPLTALLAAISGVADVPVVAAGGISTAQHVADARAAGAVAAQLGTAFLLADESGSSAVHRAALQDPQFTETVVTRAFSGRYARGLRNRFIDEHDAQAPLAYPEVHHLTGPVRTAAQRAGDPHGTNVWAGTGFRHCVPAPVAEIMAGLA